MAVRTRDSLRLDMSSLDIAADTPPRDGSGSMRQAIEGVFAVISGQLGSLRRPGIFAALCVAFGIGAAVGVPTQRRLSRISRLACPRWDC
jgi:hypothetical protein